jgi:hypothetical protein
MHQARGSLSAASVCLGEACVFYRMHCPPHLCMGHFTRSAQRSQRLACSELCVLCQSLEMRLCDYWYVGRLHINLICVFEVERSELLFVHGGLVQQAGVGPGSTVYIAGAGPVGECESLTLDRLTLCFPPPLNISLLNVRPCVHWGTGKSQT